MAELHPPQLHELGLAAALRWLAEQMPRHGLAVEVSITRESLARPRDHRIDGFDLWKMVKEEGAGRYGSVGFCE